MTRRLIVRAGRPGDLEEPHPGLDQAPGQEAALAEPGRPVLRPNHGRLLVEAISQRDFPIVQGGLLVVGIGAVAVNLLVDIAYAYIDPRISYA